jgi:hypothetical protein
MGDDTLRGVISEYSSFLDASKAPGAQHWVGMLRDAALEPDDTVLARKVLSFFGGMGSINDIVFPFQSSDQLKDGELRERLYTVARAIVRLT